MKLRTVLVAVVFSWFIGSISAQTVLTQTYVADDTNIANPTRGLYHHTEVHSGNYNLLNTATLIGYRENESITQILRVFYLENFVASPISADYLSNMQRDFNTIRQAGVKAIVRFAYTQSMNSPEDASPEMVLLHISQLKPLLQQNADVIATVQTGFVGAWGEWY